MRTTGISLSTSIPRGHLCLPMAATCIQPRATHLQCPSMLRELQLKPQHLPSTYSPDPQEHCAPQNQRNPCLLPWPWALSSQVLLWLLACFGSSCQGTASALHQRWSVGLQAHASALPSGVTECHSVPTGKTRTGVFASMEQASPSRFTHRRGKPGIPSARMIGMRAMGEQHVKTWDTRTAFILAKGYQTRAGQRAL